MSLTRNDSTAARTVHYLGGKARLLDWIVPVVESAVPSGGRACDLFAGTGVVARAMAATRPVTAADVQEYACTLTRALTASSPMSVEEWPPVRESAEALLHAQESGVLGDLARYEDDAVAAALDGDVQRLHEIVEHGAIVRDAFDEVGGRLARLLKAAAADARSGTLLRLYGGPYFSYRQAAYLDALVTVIASRPSSVRDRLLAAVMGAASDAVSSVGNHFAQPQRIVTAAGEVKPAAVRATARSKAIAIGQAFARQVEAFAESVPPSHDVTVSRSDFRDTLAGMPDDVELVYADPPYTRDHYSRFYHVLETIARGDRPALSPGLNGPQPSRGLYRADRHQSPFSVRSAAQGAFEAMFDAVAGRGAALVLSYSPLGEGTTARPITRVVDLEQLRAAAARRFRSVEVIEIEGVTHSKFNAAHRNAAKGSGVETLLLAR